MNREMERMFSNIIHEELKLGFNCLLGNISEMLNYHDNFGDLKNLKSELKKEMSYMYNDISKKMDHQEKTILSFLDIQNPVNQDIIFDQCKNAIRPLEDDVLQLKKNIKIMEQSLARELIKNEPRSITKQMFKFRTSSKLKENIMSIKCYEKLRDRSRIYPANPEFDLQKKNGTYHDVIGKTYVPLRTRNGWKEFKFFVIGTLSGNAYISKFTTTEISL